MIIKKIEAINLVDSKKSFTPITFKQKLKGINFFIGENGTGKTSFFKTLFKIIRGKQLENFMFDKFKLEFSNESNEIKIIEIKSELPTKNWFKFLHNVAINKKLDLNYTRWSHDDIHKNNDFYSPIANVVIADKIKKGVFELLKKNNYLNNQENKLSNIEFDNVRNQNYGHYFNNIFEHIIYVVNRILSNDIESFNSNKRIELINLFREFFLLEDIHENNAKNSFMNKIKILNLDHEISNLIDFEINKLISFSKDASIFIRNTFFPNKEEFSLMKSVDFIFTDRVINNYFSRRNSNNKRPNVNDAFLEYEIQKKKYIDLISEHNDEIKKLSSQIKSIIVENLSEIKEVPNEKVDKVEFKKILSLSDSKDTEFIKKIFESNDPFQKSIQSFIIKNEMVKKKIKTLNQKSKILNLTTEKINDFLKDSFKNELKIDNGELIIFSNDSKINFKDFKFSSGQELIIQLVSLIMLSDKRIFFIDEPEISLSIIWQDKFYKLVKEISVKQKKQFFLATHSYFMFEHEGINTCIIPF